MGACMVGWLVGRYDWSSEKMETKNNLLLIYPLFDARIARM